jgi:putative transposase
VNTQTNKSSVLSVNQLIKKETSEQDEVPIKPQKKSKKVVKKTAQGRPKGSKNKPYAEPQSISFNFLKSALEALIAILSTYCPKLIAPYLVLDGFYGNKHYQKLAQEKKLDLISKLKHNAHLILPYEGTQKPKGRKKVLGKKLDYDKIHQKYKITLPKEHEMSKKGITVFQLQTFAQSFKGIKLNVLIMQHTNAKTGKSGQAILFTTDLKLDAQTLLKYYSLRFQIEFDFRDAKQFYGLSSFKNYKQAQLTNAVNIAFTMTLISKILLEKYKNILKIPKMSIIDLKACLKIQFYASKLLNKEEIDPNTFFNEDKILSFVKFEAINL